MDRNPGARLPASTDSTREDAALCDFLVLLREDESSGRTRTLGEYLSRFPGLEVAIAREYLARLDGRGAPDAPQPSAGEARYEPGPVIGRGGMGEVRRARDVRLDRELAMKTLRRPGTRARERFLREACVTGRLDHPGVVPVHDLGVDEGGRPFFTMKHVEGADLDEVFERVRRGDPEWRLARALEVLIRVCDTMAFAHSRGVVHRDLKPSNVRVGRFGEVFVMDWGVAHVDGETHEEARAGGEAAPAAAEAPALTLDGDVLGTPAYMAPEQAEGRNADVGAAADVYAVGAMLYQLLCGHRPYREEGERGHERVLELVRTRAPASLREVAPRAPAELVAIADKAMRRRPEERYAAMEAVARDLRAFLDRRLVSAYRAGPLERALKWARRNRSVVVPLAAGVLVVAAAALVVRHSRREGRERLLQLSRRELVASFDTFWPPSPANRGALRQWLESAEEVVATRADDLAALEELKRRALPMDPDAPAERAERTSRADRARQLHGLIRLYETMLAAIDRGEREPPLGLTRDWVAGQIPVNRAHVEREAALEPSHLTFRFADDADHILFEALTTLVSEQEKLLGADRPLGLVDLARFGVEAAGRVEELSALDSAAWELARSSIADPDECPAYRGLDLVPQLGLVPLGRDPRSGLWEFAHVLSGTVPARGPDGALELDEGSAIVLVLVPGGPLLCGAQRDDPAARNYDPWADASCGPPHEVEFEPYFLSKHELTQAQWQRVTGRNPSLHVEPAPAGPLHPLENVAFDDAQRFLRVLGLVLPTEAQWEWAQRAGTDTPWSCGSTPESVEGHANVVGDLVIHQEFSFTNEDGRLPGLDDGFDTHAPIGSFLPNAFGFHDMMGNVREWCGDAGQFEYLYGLTHIETGERKRSDGGTRAARGGSFAQSVWSCRSAARDQLGPLLRGGDLGIRPARRLDR